MYGLKPVPFNLMYALKPVPFNLMYEMKPVPFRPVPLPVPFKLTCYPRSQRLVDLP
jgi:hypothetical protein